ncbi:type II toxin-antitoxin system HicB family antitoxin [Waddlia chondrophila]|uniref:HicB-like antitoxin of toxin-antitoxin system domain-containing protein n=1 Tax=Waddlia chondrophila (strain ATCC VR-1470 / WSU 86-1044) TaxID=716544 RepID=D6YWE0_WADCW|nr:type II toxin-antitoxin system HicB family antitoxin [Waddlia chondrophila]ADI38451.1 hypothetical protein wcw_1094 [Waddlia chondrophila WSU 86-1044]
MLIDAKIINDPEKKPRYSVEIPLVDALTQGRTKKEALEMAVDAIECLLDAYFEEGSGKRAKVTASSLKGNHFFIKAEDQNLLTSLILIRQREKHKTTYSELTKRLKAGSTFAYRRYEKGNVSISVKKFYDLMKAVAPEKNIVLRME